MKNQSIPKRKWAFFAFYLGVACFAATGVFRDHAVICVAIGLTLQAIALGLFISSEKQRPKT
ncbi:hypothetical protein [Trueperella bialowiezensis]|uniref:Uncharacterized protein n=1 Tax=Trueperella bialowiezensis TaxID=312285 RepID=A0A3S4Z6D8_9ACTO|nr:hypothetical protein [Trueperella bialowiezensis]VEI14025.1 Uncharacterised protein [Trueperella bialowiezensis]